MNENEVQPRWLNENDNKNWESKVLYLGNGASNHTTGTKSKFKSLDESVTGKSGSASLWRVRVKLVLDAKKENNWISIRSNIFVNLCSNIISLGQLAGKRMMSHLEGFICGCMTAKNA